MSTSATSLASKDSLERDTATYYGKNANYADLFGTNIHFGYFPHITDPSQKIVDFAQSGFALNQRMIDVAGIDANSNVIDFGCGVGGPIFDVSQRTNCKAMGVDLTPEFIVQAQQQFGSQSDKVQYMVGSITDLPSALKNGPKFSHLFTIQAICHVSRFFDDVLASAYSVLQEGGILVANDFVVAESGPSKEAEEFFYTRLHFDKLLTFADYAECLTRNGFEIVLFENCSKHAEYGYQILAPEAQQRGCMEKDGRPLSLHYEQTSACFARGELGKIIVVARKR